MFPRPIPTPDRLREASILPPMRYYATPGTTQFRNSLSQGVVLTDVRGLGAHYIQSHLHRRFPVPRWNWIARELPDKQFLIAPPDLDWRARVLREPNLLLGDIPFPIQAYEFARFNNGRRLHTFWVQIFDYPHDLWRNPELNQLARELGGVLVDSDPRSIEHTNLVLTRIKIAVPDKEVIPACRNLIFTDEQGVATTYLIQTIVEDEDPSPPWGHSRSQVFNTTGKRPRSPSPEPQRSPSPLPNPIISFQPVRLHLNNIPSSSAQTVPVNLNPILLSHPEIPIPTPSHPPIHLLNPSPDHPTSQELPVPNPVPVEQPPNQEIPIPLALPPIPEIPVPNPDPPAVELTPPAAELNPPAAELNPPPAELNPAAAELNPPPARC